MVTLTAKESAVLKSHWNMPIRVKDGNVELKKGGSWGILCSIEKGKENVKLIIDKNHL